MVFKQETNKPNTVGVPGKSSTLIKPEASYPTPQTVIGEGEAAQVPTVLSLGIALNSYYSILIII